MRLESPGWWYGSENAARLKAALLEPAGVLYGAGVRARFALTKPYRSTLPVICVGNFTVGGAGKTPLALTLAKILEELGHKPAFLTRGYGGRLAGPHRVNPDHDKAEDVGDEALLLARAAPTVLARDRPAGAKAIEALGSTAIIMDDGFQNPTLAKDVSLIAVDGGAGLGNGRVFPAGPLRAPISLQLARADTAVIIGGNGEGIGPLHGALPTVAARIEPAGDTEWLRAQPVLAFSGIGRPEKFFATLRESGATLIATEAFPDHYMYSEADAVALMEQAAKTGTIPVTTEKDWVRIPALPGPLGQLKAAARVLPVKLSFFEDDERHIRELVNNVFERTKQG